MRKRNDTSDQEETPSDQEDLNDHGSGKRRISRLPWQLDALEEYGPNLKNKLRDLKDKMKIILSGLATITAVILGFHYLGWYVIFGLVTWIGWFSLSIYWVNREDVLLLEYRLKGDKIGKKEVESTEILGHRISPPLWKNVTKKGTVIGHGRYYLCDYYDSSKGEIYFPDDPQLSNFNTNRKRMLDIKDEYPKLLEENILLRYNLREGMTRGAVKMLEKMGTVDDFINHPDKRKKFRSSPIRRRE